MVCVHYEFFFSFFFVLSILYLQNLLLHQAIINEGYNSNFSHFRNFENYIKKKKDEMYFAQKNFFSPRGNLVDFFKKNIYV